MSHKHQAKRVPRRQLRLDSPWSDCHVWQRNKNICPAALKKNCPAQTEEAHEPDSDDGCARCCVHARDLRRQHRSGGQASAKSGCKTEHPSGNGHPGNAQSVRHRQQQFPAHQRRLHAEALLPEQSDQHRQCPPPAPGLDLPDRNQGIDGNLADRRERHHVCHDVVQPRLRAQCANRRRAMALQARHGSDHDLLLRAQQPRRRGLRGQGLSRHARRQARGARRQDRQQGLAVRYRRSRVRLQRDDGARPP